MRKSIIFGALVAASLVSASAQADTLFSTADLNDFSSSYEPGAYIIDASNFIGASFHLNSAADISAIGGYFTQYSADNIFAAIVAAGTSWSNLASAALTEVTFSGSGADQTVALNSNVHLAAGDYQVVFGSGLFGANGSSGLVNSQYTNGNPVINQSFDAGQTISTLATPDVRVTIAGTLAPVPEADSLAMLLAGLGALTLVARRRKGPGAASI